MHPSKLSRRDLLAAFLAAPVAAAACKKSPPPLPPGEIAFPSEKLGHRVRDGAKVEVPSDGWTRAGVVVVGAGVAGLSAAWRLARADVSDVAILELDTAPGGTAKSGKTALCAYPWGAHYITRPMGDNRALVTMLREAGIVTGLDASGQPVVGEETLCREPQERVFANGEWHEGIFLRDGASARDLDELAAFHAEIDRYAAMRDAKARRAFAIPIATASDDADLVALDRITMTEWLDRKGWHSPRLRWLCDYACRDDYGTHATETSAWAGIFYWAARTRAPGRDTEPVMTWPEGNGRLVAHLYGRVKEHVRLGEAAIEIVPEDSGVRIVTIDADGHARGLHADQVVFAAPQFIARAAIRPWRDAPPPHVAAFEYAPWMVANLSLSSRPKDRGFPFAWDNVLYDSPSLGYVSASHQLYRDHGPNVITYYRALADGDAVTARKHLLAAGRDEWADVALADLEIAHPEIRALTTRLDVIRWGHAMVRPKPGMIFGAARKAAQQPYRGIHFACTDLSGVALFEEAFFHGVRAAEEVLAARGVESASMLG
ncbi:MAG TPA: FAD-dependent oxidoreductase [Polyangiaceae bacterium]|jgi:protoporphyrinogen oxidase